MKALSQLTKADRLVIGSMLWTLGGVILGALLAEPNDAQIITSKPMEETAVSIRGNNFIAVNVSGQVTESTWGDTLHRPSDQLPRVEIRPVQLKAIPYFLWGNRSMKSMRVWFPTHTNYCYNHFLCSPKS